MVSPTSPPRNSFNAFARHIYNPLGFSKAYNFVLWFIFAGTLLGFSLARLMYLNFDGIFCNRDRTGANSAAPGECYYYQFDKNKIGIMLHLATILPASMLVIFQFLPVIRHKWMLVHRLNGYLVLLLFIPSLAGVLMIARHAFGGGLDIQVAVGALAIMSLGSFILAYVNIKKLQIEQHRAWMLRGWFYAPSIITVRIIMIITARIISNDSYFVAKPCAVLDFIHQTEEATMELYPACAAFYNGTNLGQQALVHATMKGGIPSEIGAALNISFGMAMWLALAMHAIGVEVYLHLTPRETERLRKVSYQRQLEAGMRHPGYAGLTAERLGDAYCAPKKGSVDIGRESQDDRAHGRVV
ncbi:hypothetical protein EJ04DRAFT_588713 [Polyplosphaeria fusca]|uniref:Uncharacterized protein n=1 Tax=Polyplosphaeria fusca TaxID=682080 RepID=A0A9P4QQ68_9PLEO|nr:hypothetical protein EJ04DRAFT_588713 [Polyplosphaeria fusca]